MTTRTTHAGFAAAVVLALTTLGACTSASGDPATPAPTTQVTSPTTPAPSTPVSSPPASPSTSASPSATYDQALAQEAMKVNQAQHALEFQYFKEGGWPRGLPATNELKALMMGEGLARTVDGLNQVWENKIKWQSGESLLTDVQVSGVPAREGSLIALQSCRDGRAVRNVVGDEKTPSHGGPVLHTTYYKRDTDGKLKISYWTGKRVESCGS